MTQFPQLNINGTQGEELFLEASKAISAMDDAIAAIKAMSCHGRDYQTLPGNAVSDAYKEKIARVINLTLVRDELYAIAASIQEQLAARRKK